ncbi:MAG: hypothetical protein ACEPOZ_22205 [Marinifilaceae bacterium]
MKKVLSILLVLFAFTVYGEGPVVPKLVKENFEHKFELAEDVTWEIQNGLFEATFYLEEDLIIALFTSKGEWVETATNIYSDEITDVVLNALTEKFDDYNIENAYRVENNTDEKFFRITIGTEEENYLVNVLKSGKILNFKKIVLTVNDEEDEE